MYIVTIKQRYEIVTFRFTDKEKALEFLEMATECGLPVSEEGRRYELEIMLTKEKCAGSGNSEVAHTKDHLENSTD